MKIFQSYLLTLVIGFLVTFPNLCDAEWVRTDVDLPGESQYDEAEGEQWDGDLLWECGREWKFEDAYHHEYAFSWAHVGIITYPISTLWGQISAGYTNIEFDETFQWNGDNPPIDYSWSWALDARYDVFAYAANRIYYTDIAQGTSEAKGRAEVENSSSTSEELAFARAEEGYSGLRITFYGIQLLLTPGTSSADYGILGAALASGETSGAGPFHRKGIIEKISAKTEARGDYEEAYAMAEIWFDPPN